MKKRLEPKRINSIMKEINSDQISRNWKKEIIKWRINLQIKITPLKCKMLSWKTD